MTPCCLFDVSDWGKLALAEPFATAWNNELFDEARRRSSPSATPRKHPLICDRCDAPFLFR